MRTPLVATLLGLSLAAGCTVGDLGDGGGGGDDEPGGASCGDGSREGSEACDDGNTAAGDGCSATCQVESVPRVALTVDKPTISTELLTTNMVTLTLASEGGFSGDVGITGRAVDGAGVAIPGWTVTVDATANIAAGGSSQVVASVVVPSNSASLTGEIKFDITSALGTETVSSAVTAANQISFSITLNGNNCVYPAKAVGNIEVAAGTKVRFVNDSTAGNIIIHQSEGVITGVSHQGNGGTAPGTAYELNTNGRVAGSNGTSNWYCHDRNNPNNMRLVAP